VDPNDQEAQPRVLIVDHDEAVRSVMSWQLEAEGFLVDEAADSERALRQIHAHAPDVVIVDLSLPRLAGLDGLSEMRRSRRLRIIVLTGRAHEVVELDLHADDYLVKPFSPRELAARVRALCSGRDGSVRSR